MTDDTMDYSDSANIKITKVKYRGEFTHWEAELTFADDSWYCDVTAPTLAGAIDEIFSYIEEVNSEWSKDDANRRSPSTAV